MAMVKHYGELRVYERAFQGAMLIFDLSKRWPPEERFSLTDQVRRSSRSVCGCIAEAWRKRRYEAHFISKLSDADSEAAETQVWLNFAVRCGYITKEEHNKLYEDYEAISAGLVNMMTSPEAWCGPARLVREEETQYPHDP